ncbi:MAG: Mannose-6-phosphate isomerase [Firmicutes bacterium]|nr:Mannose-6-phosphate isomerase [Bacillota bacterium]
MLYPLKLQAPLKDYLWGGTKLKSQFHKKTQLEKVAESWELSCHKDGSSVIVNGEYQGMTLPDYIEKVGKDVLGKNSEAFTYFPILIKIIDAADNLSVQVHPENEYALKVEGEYGKTEMWYIVDCDEDASLLYGFKEQISKEEFKQRIESNTLLEVCNQVPVKKGDVFFIDAGTLHAINKGIVTVEIQQNSNTTYRIYDYGRVGVDGKPRQLHVEKAMDVTKLIPSTKPTKAMATMNFFADYDMALLAKSEYFTVYNFNIKKQCNFIADETSFQSILVLAGDLTLSYLDQTLNLTKGDSVFVPANMGEYKLVGQAEIIFSMV